MIYVVLFGSRVDVMKRTYRGVDLQVQIVNVQDEKYIDILRQTTLKDGDTLFSVEKKIKVIVQGVKENSRTVGMEIVSIKIVIRQVLLYI